MSNSKYFSNFPLIDYNGLKAVDISKRCIFENNTLKNPFLFYPYDISANERADQFCSRYYGDAYKTWILYLSNKMIDPYYDWYMSPEDFNKFVEKKYGSVISSQQKIKYYENNWYNSSPISIAEYDTLPNSLLKYWTPNYNQNNTLVSYIRPPKEEIINTNSIVSYNVSSNNFIKDEICNIVFDSNKNIYGNGQVMSISGNTLYLQHVSGNTVSNTNSNSYIYGQESFTNTSFTTPNLMIDNLLPEERIYYSPVSYFDYENNINETKKTIKILNSSYANKATQNLKKALNGS